MARVVLEFPADRVCFSHEISVRISDINYFDHMGHDALVTMVHEARAQFFTANGFHESDTDGCSCIVCDLAVVYRSEAHYAQMLVIEIAHGDIENFGCELYYRVLQKDSKKVVALAKTGHVFFKGRQPTLQKIPEAFKKMIQSY